MNKNEEYFILHLSFTGYNYKISDIINYIKLNKLSKKIKLIELMKTMHYGQSNIISWYIDVDLNDNIDNYEELESIYEILIEDGLKYDYIPSIRMITKEGTLDIKDFSKEEYKNQDVKDLFLKKQNTCCKSLKRGN